MTDPLDEAIGHLWAAIVQSAPSDDPIIIHHIRLARDLLTGMRDNLRRRATLQTDCPICRAGVMHAILPADPPADRPAACPVCLDTGRERYQLGPLTLVRPCPECRPSETATEALARARGARR